MGIVDFIPFGKSKKVPDHVASVYVEDFKAEEQYEPLAIKPSAPVTDEISDMIRPDVPFIQCYNFVQTIPKLQNVILSEIDNIISRDWYYAPVEGDDKEKEKKPDSKVHEYVKILNKWEVDSEFERLIEYLITDWSACGVCIIGISDWKPLQLGHVEGLERLEKDGSIKHYWFIKTNGERLKLPAEKFVYAPYWDMNREAWSKSKFHSLFTNNFTDPDVKKPKPIASIWRVMLQDVGKIHHRFAMPRVIYGFKDIAKEVFDQDIKPVFEKIAQGGRAAFNKEFTMAQETVDGTARFTDSIDLISDELEAGSGSSVNRVQTKASALADARVASGSTDDRYLGDMDRIRRLMNNEVIPRVICQSVERDPIAKNYRSYRGIIEFRWGSKDNFDYDPAELKMWKDAGVIATKEVREAIKSTGRLPLNDEWFQEEQEQKKLEQDNLLTKRMQFNQKPAASEQAEKNRKAEESALRIRADASKDPEFFK